jgi:hypothetical protein
MARKIIKASVIIFTVLIIGGVVVFLVTSKGGQTPPQTGGLPSSPTSAASPTSYGNIPQGDTVVIQTPKGALSVKNFYKSISGVEPSTSAFVLASGPNYVIWYYRADSSFEIELNQDFSSALEREAADDLLLVLGIKDSELCKLNVVVAVPYDRGTGRSAYPLSFCQSGIQ